MATINNQATLRTAVADWLNRTDLTNSQLDQFIEMGEAMIYESLRVPPLERKATYSVVSTDSSITIPSGYLDAIELRLLGAGTCSTTSYLTREDCAAGGGTWTDSDRSDDIVYRRVGARAFHNNAPNYAFSREMNDFLLTDKEGKQQASGEFNLKYHYAEPPIGTIIGGVEVQPYILEEYELTLYAALAFGSSFLGDGEAEARFIGLVNDKIQLLNGKAASAELKGGDYTAAFSSNLI
jgi:hypothetical protein